MRDLWSFLKVWRVGRGRAATNSARTISMYSSSAGGDQWLQRIGKGGSWCSSLSIRDSWTTISWGIGAQVQRLAVSDLQYEALRSPLMMRTMSMTTLNRKTQTTWSLTRTSPRRARKWGRHHEREWSWQSQSLYLQSRGRREMLIEYRGQARILRGSTRCFLRTKSCS